MTTLLKTHRNQLVGLVTDAGFNPIEFEWAPSGDTLCYVSSGGPSSPGYFFSFDLDKLRCRYCPGPRNAVEECSGYFFERQAKEFRSWLGYLRRELDAPDLWAELGELKAIVRADSAGASPSDSQRLLSATEREQLAAAIAEVKQLIEARADTAEDQRGAMISVLERIAEAGDRVGKKDLVLMVLGAVVSKVLSGDLSGANAQWFLVQIVHVLAGLKLIAAAAVGALGG